MTKKNILIIALSARPFVKAAKEAGYNVTAIDAFADLETTALADKTYVVDFDQNGFLADKLLAKVKSLALDGYVGFAYGSGFDAQPALLQALSTLLPLIGNSPNCVAIVKTATSFFAALDECKINYPTTFFSKPDDANKQSYLVKFAGGCGGSHIQILNSSTLRAVSKNHYFQQYIEGRSVSLLFLAYPNAVNVVGFNEQLISQSERVPFKYGGAVSNIELTPEVKRQLIDYAEKLTIKFGLIGLNSLDVIVRNDVVYVLEINPRLSATFGLYVEEINGLFAAHLQFNKLENTTFNLRQVNKQSNAHAIVYAPQAMQISNTFDWPDWAIDIPSNEQAVINIEFDAPICTVLASAETLESAKQLVQSRVKILLEMFVNYNLERHC